MLLREDHVRPSIAETIILVIIIQIYRSTQFKCHSASPKTLSNIYKPKGFKIKSTVTKVYDWFFRNSLNQSERLKQAKHQLMLRILFVGSDPGVTNGKASPCFVLKLSEKWKETFFELRMVTEPNAKHIQYEPKWQKVIEIEASHEAL